MKAQTEKVSVSKEELSERVALIRRFRELLLEQRKRFNEYLDVLDRQKEFIKKGDDEALVAHVELEEKLIGDIFAIQKVAEPLEDLYKDVQRFSPAPRTDSIEDKEEVEIPALKNTLEELKNEVLKRSEQTRKLLSKQLESLRQEIRSLRTHPSLQKRSIYAETQAPSIIDIQG